MQALQTKAVYLRVNRLLGITVQQGVVFGAVVSFVIGTFVPVETIVALGFTAPKPPELHVD